MAPCTSLTQKQWLPEMTKEELEQERVERQIQSVLEKSNTNPMVDARLVREGEDMPITEKSDAKMKYSISKQREGLKEQRGKLGEAGRLELAEELKLDANRHFAAKRWRTALVGYVGGIWFLKRGNPKCPEVVASGSTEGIERAEGLDSVVHALGAGAGADDPDDYAELRISLHVNVAAASNKMGEWAIAIAACEYVLSEVPGHVKALYRLAKAHEGKREFAKGIAAISLLLKGDPENDEARALLVTLKKQQAKEKKMYSNLFERTSKEGGLFSREELERDQPPKPPPGTSQITGADVAKMREGELQALVDEMNEQLEWESPGGPRPADDDGMDDFEAEMAAVEAERSSCS